MKKHSMQIELPKSKDEDIIKINLGNDEHFEINFCKLVSLSKYVREHYKYVEAINSIQQDIDHLVKDEDIKPAVIKSFIELLLEEKVEVSNEHFRSFYRITEYFEMSDLKKLLDSKMKEEINQNVNFAVEILISESHGKNFEEETGEMSLFSKIESILSKRMKEVLEEDKIDEVEKSRLYRMIETSSKEGNLSQDLLSEFIIKSIDRRFIFLKLVDLSKMSSDKITAFLKFIEEVEEEKEEGGNKTRYLEYMPCNLSFITKVHQKNCILEKELARIEEEKKAKEEELARIKEEKKAKEEELARIKEEKKAKEEELARIKEENEELKKEVEEKNEELTQHREEKKEAKRGKSSVPREKKQSAQSIIVGGYDYNNQLGANPNNKDGDSISPPQNFSLDPSSLLSYSVYGSHSVVVRSCSSLQGIGSNEDGRISSILSKTTIRDFTSFSMNDNSGRQLAPVSAVCSFYGTLYMFSKSGSSVNQLVYCDCDINGGKPVFLDIGNQEPVALFGGYSHAAAINSAGEVIFINRSSVSKSPKSKIRGNPLPRGEKASTVVCLDNSVFVLSSNGRVFISRVDPGSSELNFSSVSELGGEEIVSLSGTHEHCLAVSKDGRVFVRGSNSSGRLGLGEGIKSASSFTAISSLGGYKIRAAYAGFCHSLFETTEGKILSCGYNGYGELLLSSEPGDSVYSPMETTITSGATFCIAGYWLSAVFIGGEPPPTTPNRRIEYH